MCSTLHAMVNFHHKVKFYKHAFESKNTPCALACHQKRLWGWNGYAQTCNKANFPKNNTEGRQVTSLLRCIIIFTLKVSYNRRIHETFVSLYFISCRIYEKWIFIISSRGYITCPDRWPSSQVPAGYRTLACKLSLYFAFVRNIMRLYCNFDFITAEGTEISPNFCLGARLLSLSSCAKSESAC